MPIQDRDWYRNRGLGARGESAREQQKINQNPRRLYRNRRRSRVLGKFASLLIVGVGIGAGFYFAPQMQDAYRSITSTLAGQTATVDNVGKPSRPKVPPTPQASASPSLEPTQEPTRSARFVPTRLSVPQIFALYDAGKLTAEETKVLLAQRNNSKEPAAPPPLEREKSAAIPPSLPSPTLAPPPTDEAKFSESRVYVNGAYIVGAKWNPIILTNNPKAKDPTWSQLESFLGEDITDKQIYDYSSFVCADFAEMLHNNAEKAGIRAAYVSIELGPASYRPTSGGHALVAFQTTDRGLVFIDSTAPLEGGLEADKMVDLREGAEYIPQSVFPEPGWSATWVSMGKVLDIEATQW